MRSILEKAIVHLLNEEQDKAEALFHKFMVEKARRIHESLRSGEATLSEGWDDEITSEEYITEDDLEAIEDTTSADPMDAEDASDELAGDLDVDADEMGDEDADADAEEADADAEEADADAEGAEGETEDRLSAVEDQMDKLVADFEALMADEESKDETGEDEAMDDMGDDMGDAEGDMDDAEMGDDMQADDAEHEGEEEAHEDADVMEGKKGKIPPQFLKNMKKKAVKEEAAEDEGDEGDESLDDITESVMAELERISVSMEDGKEVGAGKKIDTNNKSNLVQASVDKRGGAKPVVTKRADHTNFDRETAPVVKDMKARKNVIKGKADAALDRVPEKGNKSAALNKDFAGSKAD